MTGARLVLNCAQFSSVMHDIWEGHCPILFICGLRVVSNSEIKFSFSLPYFAWFLISIYCNFCGGCHLHLLSILECVRLCLCDAIWFSLSLLYKYIFNAMSIWRVLCAGKMEGSGWAKEVLWTTEDIYRCNDITYFSLFWMKLNLILKKLVKREFNNQVITIITKWWSIK